MGWLNEARTWFTLETPAGLDGGSYDAVGRVPGAIRAAGGAEAMQFGAPTAVGIYVVTMRYRTDVRPTWRLHDETSNRVYQIGIIQDPDGLKQWTRMLCQEVQ